MTEFLCRLRVKEALQHSSHLQVERKKTTTELDTISNSLLFPSSLCFHIITTIANYLANILAIVCFFFLHNKALLIPKTPFHIILHLHHIYQKSDIQSKQDLNYLVVASLKKSLVIILYSSSKNLFIKQSVLSLRVAERLGCYSRHTHRQVSH